MLKEKKGTANACQNLDASAISRLPAARTDQINQVNSDYEAVFSSNKAVPQQLYRDHGHTHTPSLQS